MSGYSVFEQMVVLSDQAGRIIDPITADDYEQWRHDYIWEALHGQRYGQSFCNHFDIQDHRIFYGRDWVRCDTLIRSEWIERP